MIQLVTTGLLSLSLLVIAQQKAQESTPQQPDQADRASKLGQQDDKIDNSKPNADQNPRTELPDVFKQLDLNEQQKQQLLAIYRDSDQKSQKIWDRIQGLHRQAISMEAAAIAAARLEGHDHDAHGSKAADPAKAESDGKANPAAAEKSTGASIDTDADQNSAESSASAENSDNQRTGKDDEDRAGNRRRANRREKRAAAESKTTETATGSARLSLDGNLNVVSVRLGIAQPNGQVREYLLTQPGTHGAADANPTFTTHTTQLTKVWQEIHDGHEELVELEADTIVKVEAQLTEAQLQKLDATQTQATNTSTTPVDDSRR